MQKLPDKLSQTTGLAKKSEWHSQARFLVSTDQATITSQYDGLESSPLKLTADLANTLSIGHQLGQAGQTSSR